MTIDRRTFVTAAALVAVAPSLEALPAQTSAREDHVNRVTFMIDGWNIQDDRDTSGQLWLRLGHSWRVAWR